MSKQPRLCYISGAITGIEEAVYRDEFNRGKLLAESRGMVGLSPLELPHKHSRTWEAYMREDIWALTQCQAILMMRSWEGSRGARLEHHVATELGMEVLYEADFDAKIIPIGIQEYDPSQKVFENPEFGGAKSTPNTPNTPNREVIKK